jgi:hypothetical protein
MKIGIISSTELSARTLRASDYLGVERVSEDVARQICARRQAIARLLPLLRHATSPESIEAALKAAFEAGIVRPGKTK